MKTALTILIASIALSLSAIAASEDLRNTYYEITADFNCDGVVDRAVSAPRSTFCNAGGRFTFYLGSDNGEETELGGAAGGSGGQSYILGQRGQRGSVLYFKVLAEEVSNAWKNAK